MHSTNNVTPVPGCDDTGETSTNPDPLPGKSGWPAWAATALAKTRAVCGGIRRFVVADPTGAFDLVGTAVVTGLTFLLVSSAAVRFLEWLVKGHPLHDIGAAVPAVHIVTDPIGTWLDRHLAGLPVSTSAVAWTWGALGLVFFAAAASRHLAARLLWLSFGAATAAMAWTGTADAAHRPVAVAAVAIVWSLLSLPALRARPRTGTARSMAEQAYDSVRQALEDARRDDQATGIRSTTGVH